jgi:glycolate oxidase FAD binding subunit
MHPALSLLVEHIRAAAAEQRPLRLRGGGTKDFYGQELAGTVLETGPLHGIVAYEPSELVVTVRAGTPLTELQAVLAEQGQTLAFDPPHFGAGATVGGMVAAGLSGPTRASVGAVRDYVLGVQMVNGRAEVLQFGGQVMKNVAGYDVSRLMCGSLGTLGLISEVSLKVLPRPVAQATLRFELDQAAALHQLQRWAGQPLPLRATCWTREGGREQLRVRLAGARAAVDAAVRGMGGTPEDDALFDAHWVALREQTLPFFALQGDECLWRLSVPDTAPVLALGPFADAVLLEWGGALRWVKAPLAAQDALRAAAAGAGGSATLFRRGAAMDAAGVSVFHPLGEPQRRIHQALKQQFDPQHIFNPGRLFAGL